MKQGYSLLILIITNTESLQLGLYEKDGITRHPLINCYETL